MNYGVIQMVLTVEIYTRKKSHKKCHSKFRKKFPTLSVTVESTIYQPVTHMLITNSSTKKT